MTRVAVDALGGDRAPGEVVAGALAAAAHGIEVILHGPEGLDTGGLELVVAQTAIGMAEKPSEAVRAKPDSSLVSAVRAVSDGKADAVVSAGNTGAMLAAGLLHLRRLPGVLRPAIAVPLPTRRGVSLLLDAGANADCRPEHLVQFAVMGSVFSRELLGVADPTVRLLSIGEEPEKGNQLTIEAHALLAETDGLGFEGNAEGRDLLRGASDVVVTDGFTGNVAVKTAEGTAKLFTEFLEAAFHHSLSARIGYLFARGALKKLRMRCDPRRYNGAMFLGLGGIAVKSHGSTDAFGFANALGVAIDMKLNGFLDKIRAELERLNDARSVPQPAAL